MTYTLRDYQQDASDKSVAYLTNPKLKGRHGLVVQPTGSGKSLVVADIATRLDAPAIVFQPSKEILKQNHEKLLHYGYKPAIFSASMGKREIGKITLATIGTAINHVEAFSDMRYVLIDECHLVNAEASMYAQFFAELGKMNVRILGLTATPYRLASNSFGSQLRFLTRQRPRVFRDVVQHTQIGDLFARGYLCPLDYDEINVLPREALKLNSTGADYTDKSVQLAMLEVGFVGRMQDEVVRALDEGRKNVLVFTRFISESERLAKVVPGTAVVSSETPDKERDRILDDFKRGKIRVVTNVGIIALGFDFPELECVILGRPSISLALYYQQVGRIVRPHPGKARAYVRDMVGLMRQFGKIEDLELRPNGFNGEQWEICTDGRPLTNVYFAERDRHGLSPQEIYRANAKRRFWATRAQRGGR